MSFISKIIERKVEQELNQRIGGVLTSGLVDLDPNKYYVMIIPDSQEFNDEAIVQVSEFLKKSKLNILVLKANGVRILELT